jgi:polar amino acid transport system substrate-binding protein
MPIRTSTRKMKLLLSILIILFSVACISGCIDLFNPVNVDETKPVYHVGMETEYPPVSYVDIDGSWRGFDVESIQWIGEEMGFEVVMVPFVWKNWLPMLESKRIDIVYTGLIITPERAERINFSNPYLAVDQAIASHIDSKYVMEDFLEGKGKVGVQVGTTAEKWIVRNLAENEVALSPHLVQYDVLSFALHDLLENKIDFVMHDTSILQSNIVNLPLSIIGVVKTDEEYAIGMRKDDIELLQTINEGLSRLMASPKWIELLEKYHLTAYAFI